MIRIRDLRLTYRTAQADQPAVKGVSLDVADGQFYTLLGPSGCGKTTTLRCVAGLEKPDAGEITIGDQIVYSSEHGIFVPPHLRNIGMVFQSYAIWPHMTVFDNVAFPLRYKKPKPNKAAMRDMVMKALALVHLDGFETRPAPYLSGGQQQRLALARALVAEPRVLLLDEPLSNLDAKLREEMRFELREVVDRLNVTTLFVTHEQIEALTMSDVVAVMKDGVIVQQGTPADIYGKPTQPFVADFIGKTNMLEGRLVAVDAMNGKSIGAIETPLGVLRCPVEDGLDAGASVAMTIRPENIVLAAGTPTPGQTNTLAGNVEQVVYLGNMLDCTVAVGAKKIHVQLHPTHPLDRGTAVSLHLPIEHCLAMRR